MVEFNEEVCNMLDFISKRLAKDFEWVDKETHSYLERYIGDYIVECMGQYKESEHLRRHSCLSQIEVIYKFCLRNYNVLEEIIEFTLLQLESGEKEYPLNLDYGFAYDMVIDFMERFDTVKLNCLNCGGYNEIKRTDIKEDGLGKYIECLHCGATFNVE